MWVKSFGHYDLTATYSYFGYSKPPDVDGIKILIKMTSRGRIVMNCQGADKLSPQANEIFFIKKK